MQEPADVSRELLRLGPGKKHAIVEGVKKARLTDPLFLVDQLGLHDRDLAGRSAETNQSELNPETKCLRETRMGDLFAVIGLHSRASSYAELKLVQGAKQATWRDMLCISWARAEARRIPPGSA